MKKLYNVRIVKGDVCFSEKIFYGEKDSIVKMAEYVAYYYDADYDIVEKSQFKVEKFLLRSVMGVTFTEEDKECMVAILKEEGFLK